MNTSTTVIWLHTFSSNVTDYNHLYFVIKLRNILCNSLLPNTAYNTQKTMVNIKYEILHSMQYAETQFFTKPQIKSTRPPRRLYCTIWTKTPRGKTEIISCPVWEKKKGTFPQQKRICALFSDVRGKLRPLASCAVNPRTWPRLPQQGNKTAAGSHIC